MEINRDLLQKKVAIKTLIVNISLAVMKLTVGFLFNSAALIADAINSLTDFISDIFILVSFHFSKKPADDEHNYGHEKIETIASAFVSLLIIVASYEMLLAGIRNFKGIYTGELKYEVSIYILIVAFITVVVKEVLYRYTYKYSNLLNSEVLKAKAWDSRTDAMATGSLFIGLTFAFVLGDKWAILDPIFAVCMAVYIFKIGIVILKNSVSDLLDPAMGKPEIEKIREIVISVNGIADPHNIRTLKHGTKVSINMHIRVEPDMTVADAHVLSKEIENRLREEFGGKTYIYLHIEPKKNIDEIISEEFRQ